MPARLRRAKRITVLPSSGSAAVSLSWALGPCQPSGGGIGQAGATAREDQCRGVRQRQQPRLACR